jgi:peptidoglycan/xylan/chitin deacetylase (PgdA/CDA1 family)
MAVECKNDGAGVALLTTNHLPRNRTLLFHKLVERRLGSERMEVSTSTITKLLQAFRDFITIDDYFARVPKHDSTTITFDDGHSSVQDFFERFDVPFTLYVTVSALGTPRYLSWEQVEWMRESGRVDVQNHGFSHHRYFSSESINGILERSSEGILDYRELDDPRGLPRAPYSGDVFVTRFIFDTRFVAEFQKRALDLLDKRQRPTRRDLTRLIEKITLPRGEFESGLDREKRIREQVLESRNILERRIGTPIRHFAWTYGDYCDEGLRFVESQGYRSAATVELGSNTPSTSPFRHRRMTVEETRWPVLVTRLKTSNSLKYVKRRLQGRELS